jgi:uncharacterized protein (DUF1501 family)
MIGRREFLAASVGLVFAPRLVMAQAATAERFVFVIQRGAADGLDTVIPRGDPGYQRLRSAIAPNLESALALDGLFALHPALVGLGGLYAQGELMPVHAVASPYRDRSHFDGQNVLESGGAQAYRIKDGWLNRLLGLLPRAQRNAVALAPTVPLALRGSIDVTSYAPSSLKSGNDDLMFRVEQLYAGDPQLHALWSAAMDAQSMVGTQEGGRGRQDPATVGRTAASFLARADGPRIAMIETQGWDTHTGQAGRLANQLKALDALLMALRAGLGDAWRRTTVLVATEFGRTAAANGTGGTDHGTASAALLLGGDLQGARVMADWPGLEPRMLHEGRDLRPTLGLDALIASVTAERFGLDPERVSRALFPETPIQRPVTGLIKRFRNA